MRFLTLSVHQLVDFLLRKGDIDNRVYNRSSMNEGLRIHSSYQSAQNSSYISEYPLKMDFVFEEITVTLQGRADGIIKTDYRYIIDEIKTTVIDLEEFRQSQLDWHLGQAKCYAYMFAKEKEQDNIGVRLTYIRQGEEKDKFIDDYVFMTSDLETFVEGLIRDYLDFYDITLKHLDARRLSCEKITFPYKNYRKGQRQLSELVYKNNVQGGNLFVEAPTGIGKTVSTLFPSIKYLASNDESKIFYLTAKSMGKEVAMSSIKVLKQDGLILNNILLTAKDKICFCKGKECNPDECPYARKYYEKIQSALEQSILETDTFDYETIVELARRFEVCPFEFELDLSLFCDVVVCDYNYVFDPSAYLKRYFDVEHKSYIALIDEAHNLVDRSKEMYSASLNYSTYKNARDSLKHVKSRRLKNALRKIGALFESFENTDDGIILLDNGQLGNDENIVSNVLDKLKEITRDDKGVSTPQLTDLILELNSFDTIYDFFDDRYIYYFTRRDNDLTLRQFCLDASHFLKGIYSSFQAVTLFSATLSPIEYYIDTLGGNNETDPYLILPSPFKQDNLLFMVAPKVSIKYKNREKTYETVANYIRSFVSKKIGNYFVYFPSFEYLDNIKPYLDMDDAICLFQERDTTEQDKAIFLENFKENPQVTTIGFLVIGGTFSEGIDLVDDRLIGAVIVGVGAPKINFESDKISDYYKEKEMDGYGYAYTNPGMNKVMQAVGRVIRSESDRGAVLLIDERYAYKNYSSLFKKEWSNYKIVYSEKEVEYYLSNFFNK